MQRLSTSVAKTWVISLLKKCARSGTARGTGEFERALGHCASVRVSWECLGVLRSRPEVLQALVLLPALDHVNGRPFVLDAVQRMAQGPGGLNLDQTLQLRDELGARGGITAKSGGR